MHGDGFEENIGNIGIKKLGSDSFVKLSELPEDDTPRTLAESRPVTQAQRDEDSAEMAKDYGPEATAAGRKKATD